MSISHHQDAIHAIYSNTNRPYATFVVVVLFFIFISFGSVLRLCVCVQTMRRYPDDVVQNISLMCHGAIRLHSLSLSLSLSVRLSFAVSIGCTYVSVVRVRLYMLLYIFYTLSLFLSEI